MIGGVYGGSLCCFCLFFLIAAGCLWEFMGLLIPAGESFKKARRIMGVVTGLIPFLPFRYILWYVECDHNMEAERIAGYWYAHEEALVVTVALVIFASLLLTIVELFLAGKSPFAYIGYYLAGLFYIGLPIALLFSIATVGSSYYHPNRVFGLLLLVWSNDTVAYFVGSKLGRTKLFERISPKKTWEGTIGGGIGAVLMAWCLSFVFPDFSTPQWLALGVVAAVFGTLGDLVESMLKRSVGVKDSGNLLPGHGGLLDRFDAFIFMIPFAWLVLMIFWS